MSESLHVQIVMHNGETQRAVLNPERTIIGRSPNSSDIVLTDPRVSRVHLKVERKGGSVRLTDLYSANGTLLDGDRLHPNVPTTWVEGQTVLIGDTRLVLQAGVLEDTQPEPVIAVEAQQPGDETQPDKAEATAAMATTKEMPIVLIDDSPALEPATPVGFESSVVETPIQTESPEASADSSVDVPRWDVQQSVMPEMSAPPPESLVPIEVQEDVEPSDAGRMMPRPVVLPDVPPEAVPDMSDPEATRQTIVGIEKLKHEDAPEEQWD